MKYVYLSLVNYAKSFIINLQSLHLAFIFVYFQVQQSVSLYANREGPDQGAALVPIEDTAAVKLYGVTSSSDHGYLNSLRPSDAYMRQWNYHHCFG